MHYSVAYGAEKKEKNTESESTNQYGELLIKQGAVQQVLAPGCGDSVLAVSIKIPGTNAFRDRD